MTPQFTTYCSNLETLNALSHSPIHHLILEDPKLSLRSYEPNILPGFDHLITLAQAARDLLPAITLSFNLDILVHHNHLPLIAQLLTTLEKAKIHTLRLQDPGLATFLKAQAPHLTLHLATETGNQNLESVQFYSQFFNRQVLSNEVPASQIQYLQTHCTTEYEIQVHGPILIQYSQRRYMAFAEHQDPNTTPFIIKTAYDQDYPGRKYPFYDNLHGHLMYLYFDRCLLKMIPELKALNLNSWLFDGRGESLSYLTTALNLYHNALTTPLTEDEWTALTQTAKRPLRPGFFKANLTDQDRETGWDESPTPPLAIIVDFEKKHDMLLEIHHPIECGKNYTILTPKHKALHFRPDKLTTLDGKPIQIANPGELVCTPWQKGIIAQSRVIAL